MPNMWVQDFWFKLVEPEVRLFFKLLLGLANGMVPNAEPLEVLLKELIEELTQRGDLAFAYDPISSFGFPFLYKHPLIDFQPLQHPIKATEPLQFSVHKASDATSALPKYDMFQWGLGTIAAKMTPL